MNILRVLKGIVSAAGTVFSLIHNKPANALDVLPQIVDGLFKAIDAFSASGNLSTQQQIDSWFALLDDRTGIDDGALDLLGSKLSPDDEEFIFDHLIAAGKRYAYRKAGITVS